MEFIPTDTIRWGYVPEKFSNKRIPIAQVYSYQQDDLTVFSQVIDLPRYQIHFHIFDAESDVIVRPDPHGDILAIHYMLRGNIDCVLRQGAQVSLVQDEYNMFVVPGRRHYARLKKGIYECFHINIKEEVQGHLDDLMLFDFFRENLARFGGMLNLKPFRIAPREHLLITKILNCKKTEEQGVELLEILANELIMTFAEHYSSSVRAIFNRINISDKYLANIYSIKAHYAKNLSCTHDIESIAAQYAMTLTEVENAFEEVFGYPFSAYFENQRMVRAFTLLPLDKLSLEAIAIMLGYDSEDELDIPFEACFGKTLREMKRLLRRSS